MEATNPPAKSKRALPFTNPTLPPTSIDKSSFAGRKAEMSPPPTSRLVEGRRNLLAIDQSPPPPVDADKTAQKKQSRPNLAKKRSNFFEDAFAVKDVNPAKERVRSEALVMAEVRTNVIINDEFTFITELSYHLSTRYQRPISSIVVSMQHGACLLFGGTFDPAYVMSVYALPSQLQPTTNKRNAALIQRHMEEALGVAPSRGFLRFIPVMEEHSAWKGKTVAGEIDDLEKGLANPMVDAATSPLSKRAASMKRLSARSVGTLKTTTSGSVTGPEFTPPTSGNGSPPRVSPPTLSRAPESKPGPGIKVAKRKKSFVATLFGRSGAKTEYLPQLARQDE